MSSSAPASATSGTAAAPTGLPSEPQSSSRRRFRDLVPDAPLGRYPPGRLNSITDVPGVLASTISIRLPPNDTHAAANTGVTAILPHADHFSHAVYAGMFRFNGSGEFTGSHWIEETGLLHSPVVLTNSFAVGAAYTGIYEHAVREHADERGRVGWFLTPVVGETFDGFLNDMGRFAVTSADVVRCIDAARGDVAVPEGNTGGGTGMICHWFKGGTGSSSRIVPSAASVAKEKTAEDGRGEQGDDPAATKGYTVAALVQANYGRMSAMRMCGAPVGRLIEEERARLADAAGAAEAARHESDKAELAAAKEQKDGSIIIVLATDAPLHPLQLQRVAKRATIGLARVGGVGHNPSGDIFLAFSTANKVPVQTVTAAGASVDPWVPAPLSVQVLDDQTINAVFEAAADATEEAIYNALCMAETMEGLDGRVIDAIEPELVKKFTEKYL